MSKVIIANSILLPEVERILSNGKEVTLKAKGNSMLPFIIGGRDSLVLKKLERAPKVGDIVFAKLADSRYVVHRVYKVESKQITLMGDGNLYIPEIALPQNILATVTQIITPKSSKNPLSNRHLRAARLWRALKPIRRYLLFLYRRIKRL